MDINQKMKDLVLVFVPRYVEGGVIESLLRNRHMNLYGRDPEPFDEGSMVPDMLRKLAEVSTFKGTLVSDVTDGLIAGAKAIRLNTDAPLKQTTIDAILVDFCNFVAGSQWMDLGLYTVDLTKA